MDRFPRDVATPCQTAGAAVPGIFLLDVGLFQNGFFLELLLALEQAALFRRRRYPCFFANPADRRAGMILA